MFCRTLRRSLFLLAIVGLGLSLTAVFGWGVIGKHCLDEDARDVYNATRAVRSESLPLDVHVTRVAARADKPPSVGDSAILLQTLASALPPAPAQGFSPSRAPPSA